MANEKLETLRAAKVAREEAGRVESELREIAILELEERLEKEIGRRGEAFEIVDAGSEGPIAVRLGEMVVFKRFSAAVSKAKDTTHEDLHAYVFPCVVYPDPSAFNAIINRRPNLLIRCADAVTTLFGAKGDATRSKF